MLFFPTSVAPSIVELRDPRNHVLEFSAKFRVCKGITSTRSLHERRSHICRIYRRRDSFSYAVTWAESPVGRQRPLSGRGGGVPRYH